MCACLAVMKVPIEVEDNDTIAVTEPAIVVCFSLIFFGYGNITTLYSFIECLNVRIQLECFLCSNAKMF